MIDIVRIQNIAMLLCFDSHISLKIFSYNNDYC